MTGRAPTPYDAVLYPGSPFAQTHPDRLATLATLYGLRAAPAESCRFLELGCGNGGNVIPMAYALPGSTFLGLDAAGSAIAQGQERISALGLTNVTLTHADLLDTGRLGPFDYVVAHGLYSWVPPAVQERTLAIASEALAPGGVAYVSYNALPGCHIRTAFRQMMRWHVRGLDEPAERIGQARGFVRFLSEAAPPRPVFSALLRETLDHQAAQPDSVLFHDDLAEVNEPLLFVDFVERAARHHLAFLAEADFQEMAIWNEESPAGRFLKEVGTENLVVQQQYRDFLVFRRFRQTLLCREEAPRATSPDPESLRALHVAGSTKPDVPDPDVASEAPLRFVFQKEGEVVTPHPLSKAAFLELGEIWPRWIPVPELLSRARARVSLAGGGAATIEDEARLLRFLLASYGADVVELHALPCPFVTTVPERPRASALARFQAREGAAVTNLRHQTVRLDDPFVRTFLALLDGTRDRAAIEAAMAAALRTADAAASPSDDGVEKGVSQNFARVARLALLEA